MARPNRGKTKNSRVIRVDNELYEKIQNMRKELFLRKNREKLFKSDLKDWKIKIVYEPIKKK